MLCGLKKQKNSTITLHGKKYNSKKRIAKCYMIMQDVNHQLFTESVLDEVMLSQREENKEEAGKILKELDLQEMQDRHPVSLSGGQKQRTAICSALAADSEIIIYDEPTSGLDYVHMKEVAANIAGLKQRGKTQIIVTHDPEFFLSCCDYIIQMENGQIKNQYFLDKDGTERMLRYFCDS